MSPMRTNHILLALVTFILLCTIDSYSVLAASLNPQSNLANYSHYVLKISTPEDTTECGKYKNIIYVALFAVMAFSLFCGHIAYQNLKDKPNIQSGDLRLDLRLGFYDAMIGCKKEVVIPRFEFNSDNQFVEVHRSIKVIIPAGSVDGDRLRLVGEGDTSKNGGKPGDLFILIIVPPDLN